MHRVGYKVRCIGKNRHQAFSEALLSSWGKDTAYRKDAENWTPQNSALGQCAITALLFNELYGGKIYSGEAENGIVHYWNRKHGVKYDFTRQQFSSPLQFRHVRRWEREELLKTGNVDERYQTLRRRVLDKMVANNWIVV